MFCAAHDLVHSRQYPDGMAARKSLPKRKHSTVVVPASATESVQAEVAPADPFANFHPVTATWFREVFDAPTAPQRQGWPAIARGESTLILAPTGTGKTLTAFLWCLDRLMLQAPPERPRLPDRLHLSAQSARRRRGTQPALAARRHRQHGPAHGRARPRSRDQHPHRRHLPERSRPLSPTPARNPDHHARIPLPAAHLAIRRGAAHRRHRHHR